MNEPLPGVWPAPAKLNLFLHVTGRRADGYHTLQTLFQMLDWGDDVAIRITSSPAVSRAGANYDVPPDEDLAIRAARLLQQASGCRLGAEIQVTKRIPMGSGLGGGSSNAATVLAVLNRLWGCGLDSRELAALGLRLGADVPVFLLGHTALAEGVGEKLEAVSLGTRHYVLVLPEIPISTATVFSDPELRRDSPLISVAEAQAGAGRNDCEAVVLKRFPEMAAIFDALREWGEPAMTGTGSGIFLRMNSEKQAESAAQEIKSLYNVRAVRGVDRSPLRRKMDADGK
jgi:4-diphosphocytidyl-2-C-methyl-D-erythritol kinase